MTKPSFSPSIRAAHRALVAVFFIVILAFSAPAAAATTSASPLQTITPGQGSFTDCSGNVWTISAAGAVMEGAALTPGGGGTSHLAIMNCTIYGEDAHSGAWYTLTNGEWMSSAAPPANPNPPPVVTTPPPPVTPQIIGFMDGVDNLGIHGWACAVGQSQPLTVNFYVGASSLGAAGHKIGSIVTSIPGTAKIDSVSLCGVAGNYVYEFPFNASLLEDFAGQSLYAMGVAADGMETLLQNTSAWTVPSNYAIGFIDEVSDAGIHGWGCVPGQSTSVTVDFYVGDPGFHADGTKIGSIVTAIYGSAGIHSSALCNTAGGNLAFFFPFTSAILEKYKGQPLYAIATADDGTDVSILDNSYAWKVPYPIWFGPNTWYPGGTPPAPEFVQGDFNAMFVPGAQWDSSKIAALVLTGSDIVWDTGYTQLLLDWSNAHPDVKIAFGATMLTTGTDAEMLAAGFSSGCAGVDAALNRNPPTTPRHEGIAYYANYPSVLQNYDSGDFKGIKEWHDAGGRVDIVLMDTPLTAGINFCGFTVADTVKSLVPIAKDILALYPNVQFANEQGPVYWPDAQWNQYSIDFFQQFKQQVGVPVSYANLDMSLTGDLRVPPTPVYSSIAMAVNNWTPLGVKVAVNINAVPAPNMTQEQWVSCVNAYLHQAIDSGLDFDHIELVPYSGYDGYNSPSPGWVVDNLPQTSPSATTSWLDESPLSPLPALPCGRINTSF